MIKSIELIVEDLDIGDNFLKGARNVEAYVKGAVEGDNIGEGSKRCNIKIDGYCGSISFNMMKSDLTLNGKKVTHGKKARWLTYLGAFGLSFSILHPIFFVVGSIPYALSVATRKNDRLRIFLHNYNVQEYKRQQHFDTDTGLDYIVEDDWEILSLKKRDVKKKYINLRKEKYQSNGYSESKAKERAKAKVKKYEEQLREGSKGKGYTKSEMNLVVKKNMMEEIKKYNL